MAAVAPTPSSSLTLIQTPLAGHIDIPPLVLIIRQYAFPHGNQVDMIVSLLSQKAFRDLCPYLGIAPSVDGFFGLPLVQQDLTDAFNTMKSNLNNATESNLMRELSKSTNRWPPSAEVDIASATETPSGGTVSCWRLQTPKGFALTNSSAPTDRDVRLIVLFSPTDETFEVFPSLNTFDMHHTNDRSKFWYPRGDVTVTASTVANLMFQFLHRSIHGKDKSTLPMIPQHTEEPK